MSETPARQRRGRRKPGGRRRLTAVMKLRYALETAAAYIIYSFFRVLPVQTASDWGGKILQTIGPRMGITRVAYKNLDRAFPDKTADEKKQIVKGMWNNLGRVIAEYPHLDKLWDRIELVGAEHFHAMSGSDRGTIFWGGHLSNWEAPAMAGRRQGLDVHVVYRKPNNPGVDGLLRRARAQGGAAGHIAKGAEGAREILSVLRRNGAVGILIDQKLSEGVPVPFFGHDALTAPVVAAFAQRMHCTVYPIRGERLPQGRLRVTVYPAMTLPPSTGDREADIQAMMAEMNNMLESWIRAKPEDWLWIHKRWG